jgi:pimeloyl-ACP methyl ester carboxylesterase
LHALAEAGFHAVAPDMRSYGQTDRPEAIDQYTLLHLTGDMVGVLDALGAQTAVIAGHETTTAGRVDVALHSIPGFVCKRDELLQLNPGIRASHCT